MADQIDATLAALADQPPDRNLSRLEADVWARADRSVVGERAFAVLRWSAVGTALGLGVLAGGMSAAAARQPSEVAAFDVGASLAPSSLLGVRS